LMTKGLRWVVLGPSCRKPNAGSEPATPKDLGRIRGAMDPYPPLELGRSRAGAGSRSDEPPWRPGETYEVDAAGACDPDAPS